MKRITLVLAAVAASFAVASPVAASPYPPDGPTVGVSSEAPTPGSSITITASGFCADETVVFTITPGGTLGTTTSDGTGTATITVAAPSTPGSYTVTASAAACDEEDTLDITVASGSGGLPGTGSNSSPTLTLALIAVLVGAALVGVGALRRRATTSV